MNAAGRIAEMAVGAASPALPVVRDLTGAEFYLVEHLEPFASGGLPNPDLNRIIVAEAGGPGGEIVAFWMLATQVHVEPLWIHPDYQKRPGVARRLWGAVWANLQQAGVRLAFACIADSAAQNIPLALRAGFQKIPGDLYVLQVTPGAAPDGSVFDSKESP
jgi:hypothetical protein